MAARSRARAPQAGSPAATPARASYAVHRDPAEQPARPHKQDDQDHRERDGELELGADEAHVRPDEVLGDCDDEKAENAAARARVAAETGGGCGADRDDTQQASADEP